MTVTIRTRVNQNAAPGPTQIENLAELIYAQGAPAHSTVVIVDVPSPTPTPTSSPTSTPFAPTPTRSRPR